MATILLMFLGVIILLIGISSWDFTNGRFKFDKTENENYGKVQFKKSE